jgi:hypothetical protein
MVNLKLKKSLAKENYCNQLIIKGTCQVKEIVDYQEQKLNPQLIQDLMNFIENEIADGKYSKKEFDKSKILHDILVSAFGELNESEQKWLENQIQHLIDNKLVYKKTFFLKGYNLLKKTALKFSRYL